MAPVSLPPQFSSHALARAVDLPTDIAYPPDFTPVVLGNWASHFLSGTILVQAFSYHQRHGRDSLWIKAPLYAIFVANIILEALTLSRELKIFGKYYADFAYLNDFHNRVEDIFIGFLSVTITASVQLFLLVRTFVFARALFGRVSKLSWAWTMAKLAFIMTSFASGLAMQGTFIYFRNYHEYSRVNRFQYLDSDAYPLLQLIWLVSGITADAFICISMSWGLHKAKTGNKNSNGFLQLVINNSLRNGAVLVVAQILCFALYFATSASWTEMALSLLPRLATISLLSSIASPREAARIQAERSASAPWNQKREREREREREKSRRPLSSSNLSPLSGGDEEKKQQCRVSFGAPCILKSKISSALRKGDRRKGTLSSLVGGASGSKGRRFPTKKRSAYSLSSGVSVEMTSRVDVEEGWINEVKEGGRERLRLGNTVRIEGPTSSSSMMKKNSNRDSKIDDRESSHHDGPRRPSATPSFTLGLPTGHVRSIQTGVYDPDMDEYDLPTLSSETEESSTERREEEGS